MPAEAGKRTGGSAATGALPLGGSGKLPPGQTSPPLLAWRRRPVGQHRGPLTRTRVNSISLGPDGLARPEGGPLIAVKKVLTGKGIKRCKQGKARIDSKSRHEQSGQSNLAQMVRLLGSPSMPQSAASAQTISSP